MYKHVERLFFPTLACRVVFLVAFSCLFHSSSKAERNSLLMPFNNNIVDLLFSHKITHTCATAKHNRKEIMKLYLFSFSSYLVLKQQRKISWEREKLCVWLWMWRERSAFHVLILETTVKVKSVFKKTSSRSVAFFEKSAKKIFVTFFAHTQ